MYYLKTFASVDSSCDIWFEIVYSAIVIWLDRDIRSVCESEKEWLPIFDGSDDVFSWDDNHVMG